MEESRVYLDFRPGWVQGLKLYHSFSPHLFGLLCSAFPSVLASS